ncbi:30S ribosomal protein S11 [Verrucomicrobiota bacterium]
MADEAENEAGPKGPEESKPVPGPDPREPAGEKGEATGEPSSGKDGHVRPSEPGQKKARGRGAKTAPVGIAHIRATFNNTMVSITDMKGEVVAWCSGGRAGFKGSRKSTAFAATMVGQDAARQAVSRGMHEVEVHVQGAGSGRESAIRALQSAGLVITMITDVTPIPHNGCRARKRRRV